MTTFLELDRAQRDLDQALATFEQGRRQLLRPDGSPKYAPAEQKEREAQLLAPVQKAADQAQSMAQAALDQADQEALIRDFDPLLALASKQSDLVMVKQAIIGPSVESAALPDLARRILAIAAHGDEVDKRLYALHAQTRLDALRRTAQQQGQGTPEGFGEAAQALRQLQAGLVDKEAQKKLEQAQQRRQAAQDLHRYVRQQLGQVTGQEQKAREEFAETIHSWV